MLRIAIVVMLLTSIGIAGCASTPPVEKDREDEHQAESDGGGGGGY